jgi:hypothetical protein
MPKRTKTYSVDDHTVEILLELTDMKIDRSQSDALSKSVYMRADALCRKHKGAKYARLRRMLKRAAADPFYLSS